MRKGPLVDPLKAVESGVELGPLLDLSRSLNSSTHLPTLLDSILLTLMGDLGADSSMILTTRDGSLFSVESGQALMQETAGRTLYITEFPSEPSRIENLHDTGLRLFMEANGMAVVSPIQHDGENLAMVGLGPRLDGNGYTHANLGYLEVLTNLIATSILVALTAEALDAQSRKLSARLRELNTLLELSCDFHTLKSRDEIAHMLLLRAMGEVAALGCLVYLGDRTGLELAASTLFRNWTPVTTITSPGFLAAIEQVMDPIQVDELDGGEDGTSLLPTDAELLIPMHNQNELMGLLVMGPSIGGEKSAEKLSFLSTLGRLSMAVQENTRLFHEELEKKSIEKELNLATTIQNQLLPQGELRMPHYSICATTLPSRHVGGDYYDCIEIDSTHYVICLADVSGKGVPAALLMATVQASLRALVSWEPDVARLTSRINKLVDENTDGSQFVTCFLGILDTEAHVMHFVNAGHEYPDVFCADGSSATLETGGTVLGILPDYQYATSTHVFRTGDLFVMYSDGVTEAFNDRDEMFGKQRVLDFVAKRLDQPVDVILDGLLGEVQDFCAGVPQSDDITLFVFRRDT